MDTINENNQIFRKTAEIIINNIVEKTENLNFNKIELDALLKIAAIYSKTLPELAILIENNSNEDFFDSKEELEKLNKLIFENPRTYKVAQKLIELCQDFEEFDE